MSRRPARLEAARIHAGRVTRIYAAIVCSPLRYLIIAFWIGLTVYTVLHPPHTASTATDRALPVPSDAPPLRVEIAADRLFTLPVLSRTLIVQRAPNGLSLRAQKRVAARALAITRGKYKDLPGMVAAVPIVNDFKLVPGSREAGTTAITYLFFKPSLSLRDDDRLAGTLQQNHVDRPGDHLVGATGFAPAWSRQGDIVDSSLRWVELATVLLIFVIVGLMFRSLVAPLLTLLVAGIGYILGERAVAILAQNQHAAVPVELKPLLVVLVLAVCTDYAIFFLSSMRRCLRGRYEPRDAALAATASTVPIVLAAGLTIAACTGCLLLAQLEFLRVLGPALSVAVLTSVLVSLTLLPALMAALGRVAFWPRRIHSGEKTPSGPAFFRRFTTFRPVAFLISLATIVVLVYLAGSVSQLSTGLGLLDGLPSSLGESEAYAALQKGFAPGFSAPTLLLVQGPNLGEQHAKLKHLERLVATSPGVAGTLGPSEQPGNLGSRLLYSRSGHAARLLVVFNTDPYAGPAVSDLTRIEQSMPGWLRQSQLSDVKVGYAGDTALVKYTVDAIEASILPVAVAIGLIVVTLLSALLRSLVAPLYLVAASALAVVAPLGLTVLLFQDRLGHESLAYYVPVGAGVLLFALGSDYNLFLVGRIWDAAADMPLRDAIATASRDATGTIGMAAITLAASFALLLIIPLSGFREFAFAMAVGVLIDAFVVRSFLVPALIAAVGRLSLYPGWGRRSAQETEPGTVSE